MAVCAFTCACEAYFVPISFSRSAGGASAIQSAWPFSIWVTSSSTVRPKLNWIRLGLPSGWAAADHSWKYGLRTITATLLGLYVFHIYGPVPGMGVLPMSCGGVDAGTATANGSASLSMNSGSGAVRWKVTVPVASFVTTPFDRSHADALLAHAAPPTSPS